MARIEKAYKEMLLRKDKQIAELKEKNKLLMATTIRQGKRIAELQDLLEKFKKGDKKNEPA